MGMQTVAGLVPLRNPYIRQRLTAQRGPQRPEEVVQVLPQLRRFMAPGTGKRERAEPVQPIGRTVPAQLGTGTPPCLCHRTLWITREPTRHIRRSPPHRMLERSATLTGIRIQREPPPGIRARQITE